MKHITDLVVEHPRKGRHQPERTCSCDAAPYPHRVGSIPGCYGALVCGHGRPMYGHPDYVGRCPDCTREEYGDLVFDRWHDERGR